jgi:hypothetical protein
MTEALATLARLRVVQDVLEDESGATLRFREGDHGRLTLTDPHYSYSLQLARRSQERQHPAGMAFGEGHAVTEVIRADSDVPVEIAEESGRLIVLFQGHDGAFHLRHDHPDFLRVRALLRQAIRRKARLWFLAQKPDLALLDLQQVSEGVLVHLTISFVVAPSHLLKKADAILRSKIRGAKARVRDIRAVAKAYIDEADELNRGAREAMTHAAKIQIESRSPPGMIEKAKALRTVQLANKELQENVRAVATSYVLIAEENQRRYDEFKKQLRDQLRTPSGVEGRPESTGSPDDG